MDNDNMPIGSQELPKKKKSSLYILKKIVEVLLLLIFIIISFFVYIGMRDTMRVLPQTSLNTCKESEYCLEMDAHYEKGWAVWEVNSWIPISFGITTEGFAENEKLKITCPMDYKNGDNQFVSKVSFLFKRTEKLKQCLVTKA